MQLKDIARMRLINQQIEAGKFTAVKELVGWMGGMQAQDYAMAKWAIGIRLPNATNQIVENSLNHGEIIRTHLLRPTWHFVSADDIYWMLELTAAHIKASLRSRHKQLELSEAIFSKSNRIMENALQGGKHLTREELLAKLEEAKIPLNENRASHLLLEAELDGIACSGARNGGKQTYSLLEERVPRKKPLTREEALGKLAGIYFASRGPATLKDFVWWSGLSISQAKLALELAGSDFCSEAINSQIFWFADLHSDRKIEKEVVDLLPAYDEFLIGYADRRPSLTFTDQKKTISNNGIFRPVILVDGQVMGIWNKLAEKDKVAVRISFFEKPGKTTSHLVAEEVSRYGDFLGKEIGVVFE